MIRWFYLKFHIERQPDLQLNADAQAVQEASRNLIGATDQLLKTIDEVSKKISKRSLNGHSD